MKAVWKFPLLVGAPAAVEMPAGAEVLHVAMQHDSAWLWARVDTEAPGEKRVFVVAGTGHDLGDAGAHVGTFMVAGGALVFHVFEAAA